MVHLSGLTVALLACAAPALASYHFTRPFGWMVSSTLHIILGGPWAVQTWLPRAVAQRRTQ